MAADLMQRCALHPQFITFQSAIVSMRDALWVSFTDLAVTTGQWQQC